MWWLLAFLLLGGGCARPLRPLPTGLPEGAWPTVLGDVRRAGHAGERAPDAVEEAWRVEVGRGLLSPLLVKGPVLLAAGNRIVAALSAETGEHFWERRMDGPVTGGLVWRGERLFLAQEQREGKALALELQSGGRLWARVVGSTPFPPLLVGDAVYLGTEGGNLFALDTRNGEELWKTKLAAAASTPIPYQESLLLPTTADTLYLLDRPTGRVAARAPLPASVSAAPALLEDTLYLPLHSGEVLALLLPGLVEVWRAPFGAPILAAPAVAADGSLYVLTRSAEVWRVPRGGRAGERIASLGGAARAALTLAQDRLLVGRLDGQLFLLRSDGTTVWKQDFEDSIVAPVTVQNGAIYVPLLRGTIVKLKEPAS
ncbi:MAG: PQQ-binding-like beta-propeller repeat protein [Gemmatimonadetes bacterium]|nr:PQQ-binding-like beta-propeller repeat protein [Gemmatimonadota bacterium]